jgi:hypothetical protein
MEFRDDSELEKPAPWASGLIIEGGTRNVLWAVRDSRNSKCEGSLDADRPTRKTSRPRSLFLA